MTKNFHSSDRNFDDISQRFKRTIYDTPKGLLRLLALKTDFQELQLPLAASQVLDLGGGQGQFSLWCAEQGAKITLVDISEEMLQQARILFSDAQQELMTLNSPLQQLENDIHQQYDLVFNHAVLEWLEEPLAALRVITEHVKPGGYLSLMFYNRDGHYWRQLMNGRTHDPLSANQRLQHEGNSPKHLFNPDDIIQTVEDFGMTCLRWRGIRCIHDHMHQKIRERIGQNSVNETDLKIGLEEPFKRLGRYVHAIFQRDDE